MTTVLVAGGATGIGAAAVRGFRERGDLVLLADRNEEAGEALVSEDLPGEARFLRSDFTGSDSAHDAVEAAVDLGAGSLDTVFYNAGLPEARPLGSWTAADWDRSSSVNLRSPFLISQAAAPHLRKSENGGSPSPPRPAPSADTPACRPTTPRRPGSSAWCARWPTSSDQTA